MKYNKNFDRLENEYIFTKIRSSASEYSNSSYPLIDLGVGDVKLPLFKKTVDAMKDACQEMACEKSFRGYPPAVGYGFLRDKIAINYQNLGTDVSADEVFITDGAKGQLGNVLELFDSNINVLFESPCYPAGAESNLLRGNNVDFCVGNEQNGFIPYPPTDISYDLIYLCSPCNPTGAVMSKKDLKIWVNYALSIGAIIVFDSAYSEFVSGDFPRSIYQIEGAKNCAIEINSFSKSLGFTGIRCGYTVIPRQLEIPQKLYKQWLGRRFNGVSYVSQRGAETFFDTEIRKAVEKRIKFYKTNVEILKIALKNLNLWYNNTVCSPYVFAKTPIGETSQEFCQKLLLSLGIVATPGSGFLRGGEGYFRLSAFCSREDALNASDRLKHLSID
ncbi:MAG: LL-diaminopimelate aminotransferase [Clostridia bacterium]|nr:LL-diaminopimelate aminotransferase [Clostridia bacterium]